MAKILVVDDDKAMMECVVSALQQQKHDVETADCGKDALSMLRVYKYDLIILDLMMPDICGTDVCRRLRELQNTSAILMLTTEASAKQTELNLDVGVDDYLTKPFDANVLCARVRALLRRTSGHRASSNELINGDLVLDTRARRLTKAGKDVPLSPKEYGLLEFFLRNPNQIFSPEALLERVWSSEANVFLDTVRAHIKALRKKIDSPGEPSKITNLRGFGYRFETNY